MPEQVRDEMLPWYLLSLLPRLDVLRQDSLDHGQNLLLQLVGVVSKMLHGLVELALQDLELFGLGLGSLEYEERKKNHDFILINQKTHLFTCGLALPLDIS